MSEPGIILIEACGSAHYWGRVAQSYGHKVRMLPAQYVAPYRRRGKSDRIDTDALLEAHRCDGITEVPVRTVDQQQIQLRVEAQSSDAGVIQPLVINLLGEVPFAQLIASYTQRQQITIDDAACWQMVAADESDAKFNFPGQGIWQMNAQFEQGKDNWAYPRLTLGQTIDQKQMQGLIIEVKSSNTSAVRLFLWEHTNGQQMESIGYLTASNLIPDDGQWHAVYIPFSSLSLSGANGLDHNGKLDLKQVQRISIGLNGKPGHAQLHVRQLWLVGK